MNELPAGPTRFEPDVPPEIVAGFREMFDHLAPTTIAEREALVAQNPSGRIVMPRFQVSNVTYAPLLSVTGRPIGVRMAYDVVFSQSGRYGAELSIFAEDKEDYIVGRNPLHPLRSTIVPRPREVHAPEKEAEEIPGLLAHRTDFLYEGHTVYRFSVELVPNFILVGKDKVTPCVFHQRLRSERDPAKAFARMLASEGPTTYRVFIGGSAFGGRIESFYGERTFYRSFVADGGQDCAENPRE